MMGNEAGEHGKGQILGGDFGADSLGVRKLGCSRPWRNARGVFDMRTAWLGLAAVLKGVPVSRERRQQMVRATE